MRPIVVIVALLPLISAGGPHADERTTPHLAFTKHTIDADFENGYQVTIADIDSDGKLDIVALATTPSKLTWYKNPNWERYTITSLGKANIDVAPYDVDGDGDPDLAMASEFSLGNSNRGGSVHWLECPEDPTAQQEWIMHPIDAVPTSHRVRWADIDGSGKKELVNLPIIGVGAKTPDYAIPLEFKAYTIPSDPKGMWQMQIIDSTLCMAHGMHVVQWDNDTQHELLTASFDGVHLHKRQSNPSAWTKLQIGIGNRGVRPKQGSSEVGFGRLKTRNRRFIATIEPWHGNEVVVYTSESEEPTPWSRTVIDDAFNDGHALVCTDLDNDGNDEILAGHRGAPHSLFAFQFMSTSNAWQRLGIDEGGVSAAGVFAIDIDADGDIDVVATGTTTNNVVYFENLHL